MWKSTVFSLAIALSICVTGYPQRAGEHEESEVSRKRLEWFWGQRTFPQGSIPHEARLQAIRDMERMAPRPADRSQRGPRPHALLSTTAWTPIGPQPIGTSYLDAGRVWALAVDPHNPATVYAGTDGGGVWKTTDAGTTWTPLTDRQPSLGIASLAIDPSNSSTIYAGTGGSAAYAAGILKSTDAGATWTQIAGPFLSYDNGLDGPEVSAVAVNPANSQILLAGVALNGIYRSSDGGTTWTSVLSGVNIQPQGEVLFDPSNPLIAYAGVDGRGVYKSTDTGNTWSLSNGSGATSLPLASIGAINIAIAPSASGTVYAALKKSADNLLLGFYKSTDGGITWNQVGSPTDDDVNYWYWSLRVHPTNPDVVYAGSLAIHQSLDGGATWNDNFPCCVHVDHHAQAFSADGSTLYIGNDGGVWSTSTPSSASLTWKDLNSTLSTVLFYPGMSIHPTDINTTYAGTQDNGTLEYSGSAAWSQVICGDGAWTAIDFTNPQTVYSTCTGVNTWVWKLSAGVWGRAVTGIDTTDRAAFIPPLAMDPSNAQRLYFPTYRVYQTNDGANSWTAISPDLTAGTYDVLSTVAVAPSDPNTVYTGSYNGKVFVTRSATSGSGSSWTDISSGLPRRSITQVVVHPTNPQTAYVTLSSFAAYDNGGHIWVTANAGASWSNVTGNLPDAPVNDLVVDPDVAGTLYAATDIGVFRSLDSGVSWLPLGAGLPYVVVNSLKLHRPTRTLRAATYGRGAWDILVTTGNQALVTIGASVAGAPFELEDGTTYAAPITFGWTIGAAHTVTWLSTSSTLPGSRYTLQGWTDGSSSNPRTITVPATNSSYTANLTAQYLLTLAVSPAGGGALTANPTSSDGYYNGGTVVTLTGLPASGYAFANFTGGVNGSSPQTVTMGSPLSVTANFFCILQVNYWVPGQAGPGLTNGFVQWQTGSGCAWTLSSDSAWVTAGPPTAGAGGGIAPFSISQNAGAARQGTVTLAASSPGSFGSVPMTVTQSGPTVAQPSNVSVTPSSGSGATQLFTFQYYDPSGFGNTNYAQMTFDSIPASNSCQVYFVADNSLNLQADDGQTWLPLNLPSSSVVQNSKCLLDGAHSSVSGSVNTLNIVLAMTFKSTFRGVKGVTTLAGDYASQLYSYQTLAGTWTVPASAQSAVTVQASVAGAPFSLEDGSVYVSPVTFYWPVGAQHIITWLAAIPGQANARFSFQSWSDGDSNPRTVMVPASSATYSANVTAQYLLTIAASPAAGGSVTVSPSSPDGFYQRGTSLTLTGVPASGYEFSYFSGGVSGPSPQIFTISSPVSITANFYCAFQYYGELPYSPGPGSTSGLLIWTTGATCGGSVTSNGSWITVGAPTTAGGLNIVPYTVQANPGASRSTTMTLTANDGTSSLLSVTQDPSGTARPSITSFSPSGGAGMNQVFSLQAYDAGGYGHISETSVAFQSVSGSAQCSIYVNSSAGATYFYLLSDTGATYLGPLTLPSSQSLQNSSCTLNGSQSSQVGSGPNLTTSLGLTFTAAFTGVKYVSAYESDDTSRLSAYSETVGTWTPANGGPALAIASRHSGHFVQGQTAATYSITVTNGLGAAPVNGTVTVVDTLPGGLTATNITGTDWNCVLATLTCTRNDGLAAGLSYPAITVTVNVAADAPGSVTNQASVSLTGSPAIDASDSTAIDPPLLITGPETLPDGAVGSAYTATASATGGSGTYNWTATGLPAGLTMGMASGTIGGAPTTSSGSPFPVQVNVTDANSVMASRGYMLTINPGICDVNSDGKLDVSDVQLMINRALGAAPPGSSISGAATVTVADVQIVIDAVTGSGCSF